MLLALSGCVPLTLDQESPPLTGTTIVSLTFDDTLADQFQVGDMLAARGFVATFYVNSPRFGRSGALTLSQTLQLQAMGNEIGGHTLDHVDLTTLSTSEMQRQVCSDRQALIADGFTVSSFAYPFGADNATAQGVVQNCGYESARDVGGLVAPGSCSGCPYANTIPPANAYAIRTQSSVRNTTTLDTLKLYVTQAEQHGGGWVPLIFHHVCDNCDTYAISPANLEALLDWLAARRTLGTQVATMHDVMGSSEPPPPPPGDSTPPSVTITCNGGTCASSWYASAVTVAISATDTSSGVREVRYTTDGSDPVTSGTLYTGPFTLSASATVRVTSVDNAGNRSPTRSVVLSIDTVAPTASVSRPRDGAVVSGTTQYWAVAHDNVDVVRVRFYVDGVQIAERVQTPYKLRWDTSSVSRGSHVLYVIAADAAGNTTRSASITVTVQ